MGKKSSGGASTPSPSEYLPLVNLQAQANRVNTFTPYGSTVYRTPAVIPGMPAGPVSSGNPNQPAMRGLPGRGGPVQNAFSRVPQSKGSPAPGSSSGGGKMSQAQPAQSAGMLPTESVTTFSPEVQRLFNQQVGMAGGPPVDPTVRDRMRDIALNPAGFNQDIEQATFKRAMNMLEPGMQQQTRDFEQSMATRGLPVGGEAYDNEYANIQRAHNSARENAALAAVLAGKDTALRERGQNFGELGSIMGQDSATRGQQFNELAAILGQNQVAPTAPVDVMGPANMAMNRGLANQQAQQGKKSSGVNAGATLGAAYLMSDRRLKENEQAVGEFMPGIKIYLCNFKGKLQKMLCFMADEVEKVFPAAVVMRPDGFKMVNYGFLLGDRGVA
jgi:hypothetical protein